MNKKLNCIMLIDDSPHDNFYHERIIRGNDAAHNVRVHESALDALEALKSDVRGPCSPPSLIFLDINMPMMNGWEFLDEYNKLESSCKSKAIIIMLTNSLNPDDRDRALANDAIIDFKTKPLTRTMLEEIVACYAD